MDPVIAAQRSSWARCSAGWDKWDAIICDQLAPVGAAMIDSLRVADTQQHLDVAAGTGEPGLSIARLAPRGHVVVTDLAPEMLAVAARRATEQGLDNVATLVCSADELPFEDRAFDSVSVRFGFMFFPDLPLAAAELVRVLKPGGRLSASVWINPDGNPWTSITLDAIRTEVQVPTPAPGSPGMFRCAEPGTISALYEAAGLREVREWDVDVALVTTSPEQYWEVMSEHVSPAVMALEGVDADTRARIARIAIANVQRYEDGGVVRVPGAARCITGTK